MFNSQKAPLKQPQMMLTRREAKALRKQRHKEARQMHKRPSWWRQWLQNSREAHEKSLDTPGPRGWNVRGGGPVGYVEPPVEYQGTSVQVCGLWPFIAGSGNPVVGVPLGYHLRRGSLVCADPISWFRSNLVLNPSCFILGRPGLGKSSLTRRMVTILEAWGIVPMVLSDTKPDYVDLVKAMQGQVIRLGRGTGHLNPLDMGPLVGQVRAIADTEQRRQALVDLRGRRLTIVTSLLALVLNRALEAHEHSILSETLRLLDPEFETTLRIHELRELIASRPTELRTIALAPEDDRGYDLRVAGLLDGLTALGENGPFGDLFSEHTSEHIIPGKPMVFDISGIDDADGKFQAAVQSVCWNYGSAVVSAETHLAEAEGRERRHYFLVMDELWRMIRASDEMVTFIDALTRLNRQRGIGQALITHTMSDLDLANDHLTKIAWGFVERSGMVFLGGLAPREMGNLEEVFGLSADEKTMITDWQSEGGINPETNRAAAPPGLGKFLLKIGKKPGVPFRTVMTETERHVNDTNKAWAESMTPTEE